jgi:putative resolvase
LFLPICEIKNVEIVILNQGEDTSFAQDVLDIITVFSARLYGARSKKNKNLIDGLKAAAAAR